MLKLRIFLLFLAINLVHSKFEDDVLASFKNDIPLSKEVVSPIKIETLSNKEEAFTDIKKERTWTNTVMFKSYNDFADKYSSYLNKNLQIISRSKFAY